MAQSSANAQSKKEWILKTSAFRLIEVEQNVGLCAERFFNEKYSIQTELGYFFNNYGYSKGQFESFNVNGIRFAPEFRIYFRNTEKQKESVIFTAGIKHLSYNCQYWSLNDTQSTSYYKLIPMKYKKNTLSLSVSYAIQSFFSLYKGAPENVGFEFAAGAGIRTKGLNGYTNVWQTQELSFGETEYNVIPIVLCNLRLCYKIN